MCNLNETTREVETICKAQALANHLQIDVTEAETLIEDGDWLVLDDSEADDAWDESLDSYLEECIYPELPSNMAQYFDSEKWKRDARYDGRGHSLSSYDGDEIELEGGFYGYRCN